MRSTEGKLYLFADKENYSIIMMGKYARTEIGVKKNGQGWSKIWKIMNFSGKKL